MTVIYWRDLSPYGDELEFLCQVADMGDARALARLAESGVEPDKNSRLGRGHPLSAVAARHPGELLWRPLGAPAEWRIGAESAREFRNRDVARFLSIRQAARDRRSERRAHRR